MSRLVLSAVLALSVLTVACAEPAAEPMDEDVWTEHAAAPQLVELDLDGEDLDAAAPDAPIAVRFSEPVDPASVEGAIELLHDGGAVDVDIYVEGVAVYIEPMDALETGTTYEVRVSGRVADLDGEPLHAGALIGFTTASYDSIDVDGGMTRDW